MYITSLGTYNVELLMKKQFLELKFCEPGESFPTN
jgi:hypothetical protein